MRYTATLLLFHVFILVLAALISLQHAHAEDRRKPYVTVYSAQKEHLIRPMLERFTEGTGINVHLTTGKDQALIARLEQEGEMTPADVLLAADVGRLSLAKQRGLLQPIESEQANAIVPSHLRDSDDHWLGLTKRARVLFVRTEDYEKDPARYDTLSYEDLASEAWRGGILVRSSNNIYNQSLVASLLQHHDETAVKETVEGWVVNTARIPQGGDRDQLRALANDVGGIAIANSYYYGLMLESQDPTDVAAAKKLTLIFPNQKTSGAHINIRGAALTKHANYPNEARMLIEFLLQPESQRFFADHNFEYPVNAEVEPHATVKNWGVFRADSTPLEAIGDSNAQAVRIMNDANWP